MISGVIIYSLHVIRLIRALFNRECNGRSAMGR
jgi:hypothetical protein